MRFREISDDDDDDFDPDLLPPPLEEDPEPLQKHHTDKILQTSHSGPKLQTRLLTTEREARLMQDESGGSGLYCTLGSVTWTDGSNQEQHEAPLLLASRT